MSAFWVHTDKRGLDSAISIASARAMGVPGLSASDAWRIAGTLDDRTADFRALVIAGSYTLQSATRFPPRKIVSGDLPGLIIAGKDADLYDGVRMEPINMDTGPFVGIDPTIVDAGDALGAGWIVLAARFGKTTNTKWQAFDKSFVTDGGAAPEPYVVPVAASALPILGAVAIVAGSVLIGYLGYQAAQVVDRELARDEDSARLVTLINSAQRTVSIHTEADRAAGTSTPLTPAEQSTVDALKEGIKAIAKPGLEPSPPVSGGTTQGLFAGLGTVGVIVALGIVYMVVKKGT